MRLSLIFACPLLVNVCLCYYIVLEALNRPEIVNAKQSRRSFSNIQQNFSLLGKAEQQTSPHSWIEAIRSDEEARDTLNLDPIELDNCCRAQLSSVDWNVACASSAKYRWEDEEKTVKRRKHWTEKVLPVNPKCSSLRFLTADQLVHRCCSIYESIIIPYSSDSQRFLHHEKLRQEQKRMMTDCIRQKLAKHFEYSPKDSIITQSSAQKFIRDYHGNLLNDYMLDENLTDSRFNRKLDNDGELNKKIRSQGTIPKLTRSSFLKLIRNENSTFDQVIFFTGGLSCTFDFSLILNSHLISTLL